MRLILLGPPGAGKGTIAKILKDNLGIPHVSTGDIFREEMSKNSELGLAIKKFVENGLLVPDEVVTQIIEKKLTSDPQLQRGYLLDGFPRTKQQAEDLDKILTQSGKPIDYVIYMDAALPIIIFRLTGRRVCRSCGALFHMTNKPAKKTGVCDECSGELYQRSDDNEETIKKRMDVYLQSTTPIIQYYEKQDKLTRIDGNLDADKVEDILMNKFKEDGKLGQDQVKKRN